MTVDTGAAPREGTPVTRVMEYAYLAAEGMCPAGWYQREQGDDCWDYMDTQPNWPRPEVSDG